MKKENNFIVSYLKQINKLYPFIKNLIISVIVVGAILALDIYNIPSQFIFKYPLELIISFGVVAALIIILTIIQTHIFERLKMPIVNSTDCNVISLFAISIICTIFWILENGFINYKSITAAVLLVLSIIILIKRIVLYRKTIQLLNTNTQSVFDLKDIYYNTFKVEEKMPIIITEKDADYDLLNRTGLISQLYSAIVNFQSERSFVIGLIGKWGSGKTTLINNVKKMINDNNDKKVIVIDEFDPWIFGTQEALLLAMYDIILQHTGIKFSVSQNRSITQKLSATISDISSSLTNISWTGELLNLLSINSDVYDDITSLKKDISIYLKSQNKIIVFIIDNIDRAESDNIIFLFKLIATIFDLPNLIYLLSYDKERVEEILKDTKKINPKYLEKIIQREIYIPIIQQDQINNIYGVCFENILKKYGVKPDEIKTFIPTYKVICSEIDNLRNFKRLVNSAFPIVFANDNKLNKSNFLAIEVIRFIEPGLYDMIRTNYQYFISHHKEYNQQTFACAFNRDKFNKDGKQFFKELFELYPKYKELLSSIFPYVNRYCNNYELVSNYIYDEDIKDIEKQMSICSAKYFDLYFSYGNNNYLALGTRTQELLKTVESRESAQKVYTSFCKLLNDINIGDQKVWLEGLQQYLDDVPQEYTMSFALAIWNNIFKINNSSSFWGLSARERALIIISILIQKATMDEVEFFANTICEDISKLLYFSDIIYWLEHSKDDNKSIVQEQANIIRQTYANLCQQIIKKRINLYENPNYSRQNIWGLLRHYKDNEKKDEILSAYIKDIFSSQNVYRYIGDINSTSMGSNGYGYSIESENLKALYFDEQMVDFALENHQPQTDSEKFVLSIYQKYKHGEKNIYGERGMYFPNEIKIEL